MGEITHSTSCHSERSAQARSRRIYFKPQRTQEFFIDIINKIYYLIAMNLFKSFLRPLFLATSIFGTSAMAEEKVPDVLITYDLISVRTGNAEARFTAQAQERFNYITIFCDAAKNDGDFIANLEFFPSENFLLNSSHQHAKLYRETKESGLNPLIPDNYRYLTLRLATTFEELLNRSADPENWRPLERGERKLKFTGVVSSDGNIRIFNGSADAVRAWSNEEFDYEGLVLNEDALGRVTKFTLLRCGPGF